MSASDPDSSTAVADPTLSTLVPQPSRRRNLLLGVVGAFILWAAWASPPMLRPSIARLGSSGLWSALGPHHQVLVVVGLTADVWPYATLSGVDDVAGADVAGAWLLPSAIDNVTFALTQADYANGLAYLKAQLPGQDLEAAKLPQRLRNDGTATLIILWDITNCSHLQASEPVNIEIRSVLGTTRRTSLVEFARPGFDLKTLVDSGTCPST